MTDFFQMGDRKLISLKDIGTLVPYSREYVSRLAREGKIAAAQINRQWYIDPESLKSFFDNSQIEMQARSEYVRELRKQEFELNEWWQSFVSAQKQKSSTRAYRSFNKTVIVIILGMFVGMVVSNLESYATPQQIASMLTEGQWASVINSQAKVNDKKTEWYEAGEITIEDSNLHADQSNGILLFTDGEEVSGVVEMFSDPVVVEEETATTGVIKSEGSSTSVPFVNIQNIEIKEDNNNKQQP